MNETLTAESRPSSSDRPQRLSLLCLVEPGTSRRARVELLRGDEVVLGRLGHGATIELDDGEVSRRHVALRCEGHRWIVSDLGSRNGTRCDGEALEGPRDLTDGAVLRVGGTVIVFRDCVVAADALAPERAPLFGPSPEMQRVRAEVGLAAGAGGAVLVVGETGVGKELVARALHERSKRAGDLVSVNCAALPAHLVESELFGHAKGAFTGADAASDGLFGAADRGTLFLDEVGELPAATQPKLLRALAESEVRPVGTQRARPVDVRVIAATNRDLRAEVEAGSFRRDLYTRLAAWTIAVPPLRARRDDALALALRFLAERDGLAIEPDALEALVRHELAGNVRELKQITEVAAARAGAGPIALRHIEHAVVPWSDASDAPDETGEAEETSRPSEEALRRALEAHRGTVARVAEQLGQSRRTVYRWLAHHELDPADFRGLDAAAVADALTRAEGNVSRAAELLEVDRKTVYRLAERHGLEIDAFRDG